jgi:N-sulfoglucosamine sulfohydrolase
LTTTESHHRVLAERCQRFPALAILAVTLAFWPFDAAGAAKPTTRPPNILWLIAENIGPDLGCCGGKQVLTPNLDRLAAEGMRYTRAFATAPICSNSRSAFMTGMYQTAIGAQNHRSHRTPGVDDHFHLPADVRPVTHWLTGAGYYTANVATMDGQRVGTGKTDLNFEVEGEMLREDEAIASARTQGLARQNLANSVRLFHATDWASLKEHQPFYAQVNFPNVERGVQSFGGKWTNNDTNPKHADPATLDLPPYYPDTPVVREDWAGYLDSVSGLDVQVGHVLKRLEQDGLADNTVVVFFADNGRLEARGLDWCYDSGLHVPLIIRWPKNYPPPSQYQTATVSQQVLGLIDVTATTLAIAGIPKPEKMHGRVFLGPTAEPPQQYAFGARDRADNAVQRIRTVRTDRYRYIRNFMPEKPFLAPHTYKEAHFPVYGVLREFERAGKLTPAQATLTTPRLPDEELYDVESDPYEVSNLAGSTDPGHQRVLKELRAALTRWIDETNDQGRFPESPEVIDYWSRDANRTHGEYLKRSETGAP